MMDPEQIQELSRRLKIDTYSIIREYLQLLFLKYFYELKESEKVYFKGGTAIHLIYGSFRFSEDLDFTSLASASTLRKLSLETLKRMSHEGSELELVDQGIKEHSLTGVIKYHHGFKQALTIRLEFSLREKPIAKQSSLIETSFPITGYPLIVHLEREELLAEKVRALLTRKKGRDLFDLWFLLSKGTPLNEKYIQLKLQWYKKEYVSSHLISAVQEFQEKNLEMDLRKFLPKNYRSLIVNLKAMTLKKLQSFQAPLL